MSAVLIRDYLRTQGLKLPLEAVQVALLTAQTVMAGGQASIESQLLWYRHADAGLTEHLPETPEHTDLLRRVFMALDSFHEVAPASLAAVYWLAAPDKLVRLCSRGEEAEDVVAAEQDLAAEAVRHLAARSAQTGWLNQIDDVAAWLRSGDLAGARHQDGSQLAVPVCQSSGRVLGVVYLESRRLSGFDDQALSHWSGLALALAEPLAGLSSPATSAQETE